MKWIRSKLRRFLGIEKLNNDFDDFHSIANADIRALERKLHRLHKENEELKKINEHIVKQFNVSVDLGHPKHHRNWAVISVQGNADYVQFVDLSQKDIREIHEFLKQFKGTNRTIDSPYKFFF